MGQILLAPGPADAPDVDVPDVGEAAPAAFGSATFRAALGRFATGVTLVTAADASGPLGLVVNAFTSVSLEPPLIAICPSRRSFTWSRMRRCGRFGVNVLGAAHADYVRRVANPDADRFLGIDHELTESGVPRISSAIAFLECEPVSEQIAGDHWIVVARVRQLVADHGRDPLVFSDGRLGHFVDVEAPKALVPAVSALHEPVDRAGE
jgi:3-hydroxy-9,10-secoandrosta-1,3,5(10)-triene-9,17-dione monooxygenase reductase component